MTTTGGAAESLERPRANAFVRIGHRIFENRTWLFPAAFLAVVLVTTKHSLLGTPRWDRTMDVVGWIVALSGQALRALVIGLAYIQRGGQAGKIHASTLVQEGFFAHSRNPLYLGNMIIFLGLYLILDSIWGYLLGLPFFVFAYTAIVLAEEEFLRRSFGAVYEDYCRRVQRFLPSVDGLGRTIGAMKFDWQRLVRKEYGATFAWASAALALLVWGDYLRYGPPVAGSALRVVWPVWVVLLLAYALARYLKKTRRLGSA